MSCQPELTGSAITRYNERARKKRAIFLSLVAITFILGIYALSKGSYQISMEKVIAALTGSSEGNSHLVIWNIRMPRIVAAAVAGWGLALSGLLIQSLLRNPLGSDFTLGISQGAAFGAVAGIILFNTGDATAGTLYSTYSVTLLAFAGAMTSTITILALGKIKRLSPEAIILAGVALSSLFRSATIFVQYFATETEIASALFWTFGDVARSNWREIGIMSVVSLAATFWVIFQRWNLNALLSGEETAKGLGVPVDTVRITGMIIAALLSAVITAFHGEIGFLGLLAPHIARRIAGADHRLLIPFSCATGAAILLLADTAGRILIGSGNLPVGVLTSFTGAPVFLYLLMRGVRR